ncbi:MAG: polyprenyl synthetase family protein [Phototrophicaceae bacterium]
MFDIVDSDVDVLRDASRHILQAGGKRIRPRMVLLSHAATGSGDLSAAVPAAAAIELVHTASVVHDDINDHGVVRRGRPSVNSIWGRTFALLTGDFLFTKVYELMAPYGELNALFAEATIALVEGETLQASAVKDKNLSREVYHKIIERKTAALFKMGAELGGRLSAAPEKQLEALRLYGNNIGLAFQIVDDILDLTGDPEQLGKTAGIDIEQGKGFAAVQENGGNGGDPMDAFKARLMQGNRIQQGRQQAQMLVETGIAALDALPSTPYRDAMIELAQVVVNRSS